MRTDRDYAECTELVEAVMEWIGMRWTVSMIKRQLREYFGKDLSFMTCNYLIKAANREIRRRFNIDPQHYKGIQIEFYESIIRNQYEKTKNKLTAAERLDKLFGLEQIIGDDFEVQARKIREALNEMDESVRGQNNGGEQKSVDEGEGNNDTRSSTESNDRGTTNGADNEEQAGRNVESSEDTIVKGNKTDEAEESVIENNNLPQDIMEEINSLKDEDFDKFRKKK